MWNRSSKTSALLLPIVCAGFLCQVACGPNNYTDPSLQDPVIDPDKFMLEVEDISKNEKKFGSVRITPGSPDMRPEEFFVTASTVAGRSVPLDTMPDSTTPSINHTTSSTDVPIPTEKVTATDTGTQILVSDIGLCATPNSEIANAGPGQRHSPPDVAAASTGNADESVATPASNQFTVVLKDKTQCTSTKNFVLVTIQPSGKGMALKDFVVAASLLDNNGTVKVSSDKHQGSFIYRSIRGGRSLENIFLTGANCLGRNNKSFIDGASVSFKIEVCPSLPITPGDSYTLTVKIAHMANERHTKTESIELTTNPQSPRKGRNQASPRDRGTFRGKR